MLNDMHICEMCDCSLRILGILVQVDEQDEEEEKEVDYEEKDETEDDEREDN